ncbi:carboxyl transferase domain-containing protein [Reyranella sp. CPCC 100927]|uniref:acetyl-CoA carboxylase family protein n=1 Tax=Reyranella sp. CPCC 100927 TaxID=2599616 RepID=UPI0011B5208D|nr:carboxyl transferase domain-containing protein [Reyranella sp. CPCC 100927]TWT15147.1 carbamoyl-phosphate synthase large subunit [Reyranella sp. CPCC 100927]
MKSLLIANRGEIAIRIARSAADAGIRTVSVHSEDDALSLHTRRTDETRALKGVGTAAYLDAAQIVAVAREAGCDAIHPGYGFLAENAGFARACADAGISFVGPSPETLDLFGDKAQARALAQRCGVPVMPGTTKATSLAEARAFLQSLGRGGAVMIKAIAGGGGRGMRPVFDIDDLDEAYERCRSEAMQAFGNGDIYVEQLFARARHIEVQVVGDGTGAVSHLWERECSIQRQRQKLIEVAPAPALRPAVRARLLDAAVRLAAAARYRSAGTFEFLVDAGDDGDGAAVAFIEANARLQVEHTVTEEVTGIDLVRAQLDIAGGATLADLGLMQESVPKPRGMAVQVRVNMETMTADGTARPAGGTLTAFEPPSGRGTRVDAFGYAGYRTSPRFDSLLAKVIVHAPSGKFADVAAKAYRALSEFKIVGVPTNIGFLQTLLGHADVKACRTHTRFIDERIGELLAGDAEVHPSRYFAPQAAAGAPRLAGARVDAADPLAVLNHGRTLGAPSGRLDAVAMVAGPEVMEVVGPDGTVPLPAPMQGTIVSLSVAEGDVVRVGQQVLVMDAMKMEHVVKAATGGIVRVLTVVMGDTVFEGHPLLFIEPSDAAGKAVEEAQAIDLDEIRPDLAEVLARQAKTHDENRPDAVARRRKTNQRTTRENIADLCDPGSFVEYGSLVVAARRRTTSLQELVDTTQADSLIMGLGRVNGDQFPHKDSRVAVVAYDYTVLAGTQGKKGHEKKDRMFKLAEQWRVPLVMLAEGGGGRGSDTDSVSVGSLQLDTFHRFARLSGLVPLVGITSGRCFAGNAVLLGCCDVVIATANSTIGMGGPAMIEGGGLGVYRPEEVGPMSVQVPNGVVDIAVEDEAEAVQVARQYLSYFQGPVANWRCADQRHLRHAVPLNRLRAYDMRALIETMADTGSMLEIRRGFGAGMITALIRIEGQPIGVVANNPAHLAGAIDSPAADKGARFMQLCDAHDIPLLFLCDTPGNMVGPEHEKTALVRHCCRTYLVGANVTVPTFTVVIRKAYGLGALGMAGGSFHASVFAISWPTGEFGGMGLEGQVKLGRRKELAAIEDSAERMAAFERMVAEMYERGKALNTASLFELDDVIDPADTRKWIMAGLRSMPLPPPRTGKKRPCVDGW